MSPSFNRVVVVKTSKSPSSLTIFELSTGLGHRRYLPGLPGYLSFCEVQAPILDLLYSVRLAAP